jgi:hypothetical protein
MQEAGRAPNESVHSNLNNLGNRDMDTQYDWNKNSPPDQIIINLASSWIADHVKESPNDEIQTMPDNDWRKLEGEQ